MQIVTAQAGVLRLVPDDTEPSWWQLPTETEGKDHVANQQQVPDTDIDAPDPADLERIRAGLRLADQLRGKLAGDMQAGSQADPHAGFRTGLAEWDLAAPGGAFAYGAVHELLFPPRCDVPRLPAALLAIAAARSRGGWVAWSDPDATLYPPALAKLGLSLGRLLLVRPAAPADESWAATECLRCRGVSATVVEPTRLSRVEARRLQLAAEQGGGVGIFLRTQRSATDYAAATRWLVRPMPGDRTVQRWTIELLHGHGGRIGHSILLEVSRDVLRHDPDPGSRNAPAHPVRAAPAVVHRAGQKTGKASA